LALSFLGVSYFTYAKLTSMQDQQDKLEKQELKKELKLAMEN